MKDWDPKEGVRDIFMPQSIYSFIISCPLMILCNVGLAEAKELF